MRRLRRGQQYLDKLIYGLIAERRADPRDRGDLLSMLLNATDDGTDKSGEHAAASRGSAERPAATVASHKPPEVQTMSDVQLRDECVTVILAGHETTANALLVRGAPAGASS